MSKPDQRDEAVERLLQASLRGKGVGGVPVHGGGPVECPDGETLAAWADGGLSPGALASVELHLAGCARCQAVLATLAPSTADASSPSVAWWRRGFGLGWLVPVAGAVAAIAIWIAVPDNNRPLSPSSTAVDRSTALERQDAPAAPAPPPPARVAEPNDPLQKKQSPAKSDAPRVDAVPPQRSKSTPLPAQRRSADQDDKRERDEAVKAAPAAAASTVDSFTPDRANRAPAAAAQASERARSAAAPNEARAQASASGPIEIVAPDRSSRWRVGPAGAIQHSADRGSTWQAATTGVSADLVAGTAPASTVCWVVGRGGTVLLTVDGGRWERLPFPEPADLVSVQASDARTATVTTADRRRFRSTDAGRTWTRTPLQEF